MLRFLFNLNNRFKSLAKSHYNALFVQLEFVQTEKQARENQSKVAGHFLFRFGVLIWTVAYGTIGLHYESSTRDLWKLETLKTSPFIWIHQTYPPQLWRTMDIVLPIVTTNFIFNSLASARFGMLEYRYRMIAIGLDRKWILINGKQLSYDDSERILVFHSKAKYVQNRVIIGASISCLGFLYAMILYNSVYVFSILSSIYWLFIVPFFAFTIVYEMFAKIIYVFMSCEYLCIRQRSLLSQLVELNRSFERAPSKRVSLRRHTYIWNKYMQLSQSLLLVCRDLHAYAIFWSPFLTLAFINNTTYVSYMLYTIIVLRNNPLAFKIIYGYFICCIGLLFYSLIRQCAKVVKGNHAILRQNAKFYLRYQDLKHTNFLVKGRRLLVAESLLVPRSMHSYAFYLFGDYRITSKSFNVIIGYVAVLFIWIIKNQQKIY